MALLAMPALAAEPNVGGYVGTLILGQDHELYAPMSGKHLDQPLTVSIGGRAGLSLTQWFDIEGELEIGAWPVEGGTATIAGMRVGPRFIAADILGQGRDIHLTAGVGNLTVMAPNSLTGTDVDFAAHIGPGVSIDVGKRISLRGDYRALITSHEGASPLPSVQSLITLGASMRLGAVGTSDVPEGCPGGFAVDGHCVGIDPMPEPVETVEVVEEVVIVPPVVVEPPPPIEPEIHPEIAVIADTILFDTDSWGLPPDSLTQIEQLAGVLNNYPGLSQVRVEGHTDDTGTASTNQRISQSRVDEVARMLISFGVDEELITAEGFGEASPVADNTTVAGRAENRRVEIHAE
jgi:outer membrane protein OmpA-like peptidoglycan-associated protein